jgi:hypothetical protein
MFANNAQAQDTKEIENYDQGFKLDLVLVRICY